MAQRGPPDTPAILESASSQFFFADRFRLQVKRDTVWLQLVTKQRSAGRCEYIVTASGILLPWSFSESLAELNVEAMKAGLTISGNPKIILN